jgi:hypothetical protein
MPAVGVGPMAKGASRRWMVLLGLVFYCSICWAVVAFVGQAALRQWQPEMTVAEEPAASAEASARK